LVDTVPEVHDAVLLRTTSGIAGLDEITHGGLPKGRSTLVAGGPGCGKTIMAMQFLVAGARDHDEPGVFFSFEEDTNDILVNTASLALGVDELVASGKLAIRHIGLDGGELQEAGAYDLNGLFIRLDHAISEVGAQRVALDTIETLFTALPNEAILRSELRRLFVWLKDRGVTSMITAEKGVHSFTRHGLEEYVSDCVIALDHRVYEQIATRRMRVVKYRGSNHGTGENPFLIDDEGITVMPVASATLEHQAYEEAISSGVPDLDDLLGGRGFYKGTTVLVTGAAGTGKSTLAAHFVDAACRNGHKAVYFAFEESRSQIARNMRSVGFDMQRWVDEGTLAVDATRPSMLGLEHHLTRIHKLVSREKPEVVVLDPVTDFDAVGSRRETKAMLMRIIDYLKSMGITTMLTSMSTLEADTDAGISSIIDTWIQVRNIEGAGERNRGLYVLKSRGMSHSNQIREFLITDAGVKLVQVYVGEAGVLIGSARKVQEERDRSRRSQRGRDIQLERRNLGRARQVMEAQVAALQAEFAAKAEQIEAQLAEDEAADQQASIDRAAEADARGEGKN
jgi:circadian clock protein KaiC